jgi:hypothetical protein
MIDVLLTRIIPVPPVMISSDERDVDDEDDDVADDVVQKPVGQPCLCCSYDYVTVCDMSVCRVFFSLAPRVTPHLASHRRDRCGCEG